jgi:DNA polymerase-3 subunit beta
MKKEKPAKTLFSLNIKRENLEKILPLLAVERSPSMPVLECLYFIAGKGKLSLASTNLTVWKRHDVQADVKGKGVAAVNFAKFKKFLSLIPKGDDINLHWSDHSFMTFLYPKGKLELAGIGEDIPCTDIPKGEAVATLPTADFLQAVNAVKYAVATDLTKYNLTNVWLQTPAKTAKLRAAATDGHRMALHEINVSTEGRIPDGLFIHGDMLSVLNGFTGDKMQITKDGDKYIFRSGPFTVWENVSDCGQFPEVDRVTPQGKGSCRVKVSPVEIIPTIMRGVEIASEKFAGMKCTFIPDASQIEINVNNPALGVLTEMVGATYLNKSPIAMRLNGRYLLDMFKRVDGPAVIDVYHDTHPIKITAGNDTAVIMPMRV